MKLTRRLQSQLFALCGQLLFGGGLGPNGPETALIEALRTFLAEYDAQADDAAKK